MKKQESKARAGSASPPHAALGSRFALLLASIAGASLAVACGRSAGDACTDYDDCPAVDDSGADGGPPLGADATIPGDSAVAPTDAGHDGTPSTGADSGCTGKVCGNACVELDDPSYGCAATTCSPCSLSNATATCTNGTCAVAQCTQGYAQCPGDDAGCGTNIATPQACGSCTTACDAGLLCADDDAGALACVLQCPANAPTSCGGSCTNVQTSNQHCGNCNSPCTAPTGATSAQCTGGVCDVTCASGYHECQATGPCYPNGDAPTAPGDTCIVSEQFGVFVATTGSDSAAGTRAAPLKTIQAGITAAQKAGKRVYVCAGNYSEADTLATNVSIYGYFTCAGGTWAVGTGSAVVTSPTSPAVTATNVTGVTIQNVEWKAPDEASSPSSSSFGMIASGSTLTLIDVALVAGAAGSGTAGGVAAAPTGPTAPCAAGSGAAPGSTVTNGTAGTPAYSASGYTPAQGGNGTAGANGNNGTLGGTGSCAPNGTCSYSSSPLPHCNVSGQVCSGSGSSGCGGPGGANGIGGTGGGTSVALLAWNSAITLTGGSLTSGDGGNGGAGGAGQAAASSWPGSSGAAGKGATQTTTCGSISGSPPCATEAADNPLAGGTTGGDGQPGWPGGSGASGSAGDSYSYVTGGGGTVTPSSTTTFSQGTAGTSPGPIAGSQGHAGEHN